MTVPHDPIAKPSAVRSERKTGIWSVPPVVLVSIVALVIGLGHQLWHVRATDGSVESIGSAVTEICRYSGSDQE
ncbi:MAG: hypothetical protein ABI980_01465 [Nitrospirota bacterium]